MPNNDTVYVSFSAEILPHTTEALLGLMANISNSKIKNVYLFLSTAGGSVMHGFNLFNMLKGMPFKLITHNVGNVDSIGNIIFLAGEKRYSCAHSTFMFHGVGFNTPPNMRLEEKILRERLGSIQADQNRIGKIITDRTSITNSEVRKLFREAKTRDPDFARSKGIIHDIREVEIPLGATVQQLVFQR